MGACGNSKTKLSGAEQHAKSEEEREKSQEAKKALRLKRQIDLAAAQEAVERLQKQGKMDEMAEVGATAFAGCDSLVATRP